MKTTIISFAILFCSFFTQAQASSECGCHLIPQTIKRCHQAVNCGAPADQVCHNFRGWNGCKAAGRGVNKYLPWKQIACLDDVIVRYCDRK